MDVGFLVWQLGGDKCLMLPILDHGVLFAVSSDVDSGYAEDQQIGVAFAKSGPVLLPGGNC